MALPKVCGIETEYGIVVRGAENNPVSASSLLINAYVVGDVAQGRMGLRGRAPGQRRPRVLARRRARPRGRDDTRQRGAHQRRPLLRRPRPPRDLHPRGVDRSRGRASGTAPPRRSCRRRWSTHARSSLAGGELVVYKNNSDGKGNSYGCHENYLLARELPFGRIGRTDHTPLRHPSDLLRGGQGGLRAAREGARRGRRTRSASGPTSSRRRSASRPPSSARSSTPATSRTAIRRSTAAST